MPTRPSALERAKSSASSSPKLNSGPGASKDGKESRKLSSLSSEGNQLIRQFQATLNFSAIPKTAPKVVKEQPSSSGRAGPSTARPFARTASGDARAMPPPAVPVRGELTSSSPAVAGPSKMVKVYGKNGAGNGSFKGKEREDPAGDGDCSIVGSRMIGLSSGMWADMYAPTAIADLAPGKARIASVRDWMYLAIHGHAPDAQPLGPGAAIACERVRKYKRILFVTGPPGIAKSTSVRVIAQEMGVDLVEWNEGVEEYSLGSSVYDRESPITKLSTFLSRNDYTSLSLSSSPSPSPSPSASSSTPARPKVLLITALPNLSHGPTKEAFHSTLAAFARTYTPQSSPLIIVHSEVGNRGAAEESWRDRERGGRDGALDVMGKEVMEGPWATEVSFLPIAPTFLIKALRRILELARSRHDFEPPAATALQLVALTSNGDLRAAINSVQLLCTHGQARSHDPAAGQKRKAGKNERGTGKVAVIGKDARGWVKSKLDVPKDVRAVLDALTRKEQNLKLFHALGKVLYNKRLGDPGQAEDDQELVAHISALPPQDELPNHLSEYSRRRSLVIVDDFVGNIPVDASSFALWLHQNAPNNCEEIEEAVALLDDLGSADIMKTDDDIWQSSTQAIAYALHISVRGVQMGLPSPVPRRGAKVTKPQFFQSFKDQRKNTDLVDVASAYVTKKAVAFSNVLAEQDSNQVEASLGVWGGMMSQGVLAAEVLPMMIKMQGLTSRPLLPATVAPLRMAPYDTRPEMLEELTATQMNIDKAEMDMSSQAEEEAMDKANHGWDMEEEVVVEEKGWLEEDDIEDFD